MNYKSFFLLALICSIGSACSPRISTNIVKSYPPQSSETLVAVYTREQVDNDGQKTTEKLDPKKGESLAQFGLSLGICYYIK